MLSVTPLSPPLLVAPDDEAELVTPYPQLSWMPPVPAEMLNGLNYDLKIVEVKSGQKPVEAILNNPLVYTKANLKYTAEPYPSTLPPLEKGKVYAWQVMAKNSQANFIATDVWTFSIRNDSAKAGDRIRSYVSLKKNRDEASNVFVSGKLLDIKLYSFEKEYGASVRIYNARKQLIEQQKQTIHYGENYLTLELNASYEAGVLYLLELKDPQGAAFYTHFTISQ